MYIKLKKEIENKSYFEIWKKKTRNRNCDETKKIETETKSKLKLGLKLNRNLRLVITIDNLNPNVAMTDISVEHYLGKTSSQYNIDKKALLLWSFSCSDCLKCAVNPQSCDRKKAISCHPKSVVTRTYWEYFLTCGSTEPVFYDHEYTD